ncbi:MAG TPA: endonuclease/exonuclease/phosphatase family protein, partial [Tepidisphaeraceae bacterium]|nr:endonuclease/exonuclease/phosphatase family protein [Tepidisphaeraceae bacterium]
MMTFNLRHGLAMDKENSWQFRQDAMVSAIKACDPDILGTQECLDFQAQFLAEKLPNYGHFGVGREKG